DFRSAGGIYDMIKQRFPGSFRSGKDLFDITMLKDHKSIGAFNMFMGILKERINNARPTPTHHFLKKLDNKKKLVRVYTQNIDNLEEVAGLATDSIIIKPSNCTIKAIQLHGTMKFLKCSACSEMYEFSKSHCERFKEGESPSCPRCEQSEQKRRNAGKRSHKIGILKPNIVLYGDNHSQELRIGKVAAKDSNKADCMIIMGTSLQIPGIKDLIRQFAVNIHKKGGKIIVVNLTDIVKTKEMFGQPIDPSSSSEGSGVIGKDEQASNELKANVIDGDVFDETAKITDKVMTILTPLSPAQIPIIRCVGLNYKAHAHEISQPLPKYPILFIKPSTSLQNPNDKILVPSLANNNQTDYEAELAVVLNKDCKNVDVENALNYVLGYTCANDVSARKWQGKMLGSGQWCFSKGFDTFCPIGPVLVSPKLIKNPNSLGIRTIINGKVLQNSNTKDKLISFLSKGTTLQKGSMILTGTPEGVGFTKNPPIFLQHNDTVVIEIDKIGSLTNTVEYEN
ncbi:906_t:CDS:2, partial [Entrophospora sp. SA101]